MPTTVARPLLQLVREPQRAGGAQERAHRRRQRGPSGARAGRLLSALSLSSQHTFGNSESPYDFSLSTICSMMILRNLPRPACLLAPSPTGYSSPDRHRVQPTLLRRPLPPVEPGSRARRRSEDQKLLSLLWLAGAGLSPFGLAPCRHGGRVAKSARPRPFPYGNGSRLSLWNRRFPQRSRAQPS